MDEHSTTIGTRLRELRRWRHMTLAEVAGLAGVTASYISMIENGRRPLDRRSLISALAVALKVSETELTGGPHLGKDPVQFGPHAAIPALRLTLQTNTLTDPVVDRARPLADLAEEMSGKITPLHRNACDYVQIGYLLPSLIDELHLHVAEPADEAASRLALETLIEACTCATSMCWGLDYFDLAHLAALRAREAAAVLGDPVQKGKADWSWLLSLPRAGSRDRKLAAAERVANELEPHAHDPLGLQVLGMVALTAGMAAAAAQRGNTATHWLGEAKQIAARLPDQPMANWQLFSATNVGVWQVGVSVELGEAGRAVVERAQDVNLGLLAKKSHRRAALLADVGRGLAREPGTRDEAVRWLRRAEEAAPQWIRNSTSVRETVIFLLNRTLATTGGRELRGMAARMGVPH